MKKVESDISMAKKTKENYNVMQHRFTRMVSGMGNLTYEERLAKLGLTTLQDRRVR